MEKIKDKAIFKFITVVVIPLLILIVIETKMNDYYKTVVILLFINVILAAATNFTNGITGIFSLGTASFMAIGAYVGSLLTLPPDMKYSRIQGIPAFIAEIKLPFFAALLISGLFAAVFAGIIGIPILRAKGHYLAVITLGTVIVVKSLLDNLTSITNGSRGISGMEGYSTLPVTVLVTVLSLYVMYRIKTSSLGRGMIALKNDEDAAESLGISRLRVRLFSFMISAFFAGIGGCLWAHLQRSIAPSMFYLTETFMILEMSVLGGMESLSGAIPGAAIITFFPYLLSDFSTGGEIFGIKVPKINGITNIVMSVLFILVMIFRKGGIFRENDYIFDAMFSPDTYSGLFKKEHDDVLKKDV